MSDSLKYQREYHALAQMKTGVNPDVDKDVMWCSLREATTDIFLATMPAAKNKSVAAGITPSIQ
jgi:hypothetical protein